MDRSRFLLVLGIDAEAWAKRYGIEPASAPCYHCDEELHTSIPFAVGRLRGLVAPVCGCGNTSTPYCVVSAEPGDVLTALAAHAMRTRI